MARPLTLAIILNRPDLTFVFVLNVLSVSGRFCHFAMFSAQKGYAPGLFSVSLIFLLRLHFFFFIREGFVLILSVSYVFRCVDLSLSLYLTPVPTPHTFLVSVVKMGCLACPCFHHSSTLLSMYPVNVYLNRQTFLWVARHRQLVTPVRCQSFCAQPWCCPWGEEVKSMVLTCPQSWSGAC